MNNKVLHSLMLWLSRLCGHCMWDVKKRGETCPSMWRSYACIQCEFSAYDEFLADTHVMLQLKKYICVPHAELWRIYSHGTTLYVASCKHLKGAVVNLGL